MHLQKCLRSGSLALVLAAGCGGELDGGDAARTEDGLSGCKGHASSSIPPSGDYFLTSFGGGSDTQSMSCGGRADGSWYYAASKQRFGCGAHLRIEANGKCVVARTDDYGPDVCVESAAGRPIIDASPLVAEHLFGVSSAGWSDRLAITATLVDASTALGPCDGSATPPDNPPNDPPANSPPPDTSQCYSSTLGENVPAYTCVQSIHDGVWYQCATSHWRTPVVDGAGPAGPCSAEYPL